MMVIGYPTWMRLIRHHQTCRCFQCECYSVYIRMYDVRLPTEDEARETRCQCPACVERESNPQLPRS